MAGGVTIIEELLVRYPVSRVSRYEDSIASESKIGLSVCFLKVI